MKQLTIIFTLLFFNSFAFAGKPFPELKGHTLDKKEVSLPSAGKGKFTVIGIASSMRAQNDLQSWFQPMYTSFAENPMYQYVKMYIIPMTKGFIMAGPEKIEKQIKSNTDTSLYKYILVYAGEVKPMKKELGMDEDDKPYIIIIDPRGEIVYKTSGKYSEQKLEEITDKLSE